jgi:hypothetical protein
MRALKRKTYIVGMSIIDLLQTTFSGFDRKSSTTWLGFTSEQKFTEEFPHVRIVKELFCEHLFGGYNQQLLKIVIPVRAISAVP